MTIAEKINQVKVMMNISTDTTDADWTDGVILAYLNISASKILNRAFPYATDITEVPTKYEMLQCEIAIYLLNKRGAEGQTSHSENGISRGYESADVPESMLKEITPYCEVVR